MPHAPPETHTTHALPLTQASAVEYTHTHTYLPHTGTHTHAPEEQRETKTGSACLALAHSTPPPKSDLNEQEVDPEYLSLHSVLLLRH